MDSSLPNTNVNAASMAKDESLSTIQITNFTRERLASFKRQTRPGRLETYEELLTRLLDEIEQSEQENA